MSDINIRVVQKPAILTMLDVLDFKFDEFVQFLFTEKDHNQKSEPLKMQKWQLFEVLKSQKLISRKISEEKIEISTL